MEVESAEALLYADGEPKKRLFFRTVRGPVYLRLERTCSLVVKKNGMPRYIQGEGQLVEIPADSPEQWIVVCERPFAVMYGFCDLGQYLTPEQPCQVRNFGLSGVMQLRFLYSAGFCSLVEMAGEREMLTANDVLPLLRQYCSNALRSRLHDLLKDEPWEYSALIKGQQHLPGQLYQCFDAALSRFGLFIVRGSLRITGYALYGNSYSNRIG